MTASPVSEAARTSGSPAGLGICVQPAKSKVKRKTLLLGRVIINMEAK